MIYQKSYTLPGVNIKEALRYAGARGACPEDVSGLSEIALRVEEAAFPRAVFAEFPLTSLPSGVRIGDIDIESMALRRHLSGCERCTLLFATVGIEVDRLTLKYGARRTLFALLCDAVGSERAEALADAVTRDIKELAGGRGYKITRRFSPGYLDLPLNALGAFAELLSIKTRLGISISESYLMSPKKSISAIIGYYK